MTGLHLILIVAASLVAIGLLAIVAWFFYTGYLARLERRLTARKGVYRELVSGLATRERALLEPELHQRGTYKDFEALEAVLEEQARGATERPEWLLDTYDRLGLVDKYVDKLRTAKKWRERAFAAELLGRVGNAKAVPALLETIQATRTEDADVREIALRALARIADPRAVEPLVEALKRAEVWLAPRIADILVRHGHQVVDPMIGFLEESIRHPARAWAANILGELKVPRAFPALVRALNDLDDEVRAKAAGALGRLGDKRAITYLLDHLLSDPAPFVRARIAGSLGQFNDTEVIDRLVRALGDPAWWVRMRSVEALEQIGPVAEAPLMLALDDPDPEIRIRAAVGLERLGVPSRIIGQIEAGSANQDTIDTLVKFGIAGARELLAENLVHHAPRVRSTVVEAIRRAGRQDLFPELIETARKDSEPRIRAAALETLHALGVRESLQAALDGLGDVNHEVRAAAMTLIGDLGTADLGAMIRPRTSDPEPLVRAAAARALGLVGAHGVDGDIGRLLRDPAPAVRIAAADGVAEGRWSGAVPILIDLLGDTEPGVRIAAARALGAVGDPSAVPVLLKALRTASTDLREAIITALSQLQVDSLQSVLDVLLEGQDVRSRLGVVRAISQLRTPQSFRLLEILWRDSDPGVRAEAGVVLGKLGDDRAAELLATGLADPAERVRACAVDALLRLHRTQYAPRISQLLESDPSSLVRERSALAIGLFKAPGGEVQLLKACGPDQPIDVRSAAVLALGAFDQESMVARVLEMADEAPLRELLRDQLRNDAEFRLLGLRLREARHIELRALATTSREQMEQVLAEGMRGLLDAGERIRLVAGLRAFQGERSRSALLQVVRSDPSPEVRAAALTAVGGMLDKDELYLTARRALSDPHPEVRRTAVTLFSRVAPDLALPSLVRMLRASDDPVILRAVAAQAEAAFDVFLDLTLGLSRDGQEAVTVAQTARYIHHPDLERIVGVIGKSRSAAVRQAVAELWSHRPELIDEDTLIGMTADPTVAVRKFAVRACAAARHFDRIEGMLEDPDPEIRQEVALGLCQAPAARAKALRQLREDPDATVRATVFAVRLIRGEIVERPANVVAARPAADAAIRRAALLPTLRETARTDADPEHRLRAGLALAVLNDEVAQEMVRTEPVKELREQVARMLGGWEAPE